VDTLAVPATQATVIPVAVAAWVVDVPLAVVSLVVHVVTTGGRHNATTRLLEATVWHEGQ
jgi:hypothetical protein